MLRKKHRLIPIFIVLFWLIMMGLLVYRESVAPRLAGNAPPRRMDKAQDLWLGVFVASGERVGFVHATSDPGVRDGKRGVRMGISARIVMSLFNRDTDFLLSGDAWISQDTGLDDFDVSFSSGEHQLRATGRVADNVLQAQVETAGETLPISFQVGNGLLFSGGMGLSAFDVPLLEPGRSVYVDSLDPTTMSVGKAKVACVGKDERIIAGETLEVYVMETTIGGLTTRAWVTADEEVVRAETPFGFVLEKITPQEALAPVKPTEQASLIRTMAIRPTGVTPKRDITLMRVRFSGIPEDRMPPSDAVQTQTPAGYVITVPDPLDTSASVPLSEEEREADLASDSFISASHPKIIAAAQAAAGEETDPWKQALRLHDWVFLNIDKNPVISVPTALEVLETREGDCNEHATLYVAMARALGIPARIAIGIVWSEELQAFGYHAWAEVYTGQWIPVDPTFGQPVADATHIKLLNGGIEAWAQLLPYIGQLQIEILEAGRK